MLIISSKKRVPEMKLSDYTAKAPDVYFSIVSNAKDHFRRSIVATLYVSIDSFIFETTGAKVNYPYARFIGLF